MERDQRSLPRTLPGATSQNLVGLRCAIAFWAFMGLLGIPMLVVFDPLGGWRWQPYNAIYDQMIVSIYVALGACALRAIRHPLEHASFLWFVVLSSVTHGGVMLYHAVIHPVHAGHLLGDVWILAGALSLAVPLFRARSYVDATAASAPNR